VMVGAMYVGMLVLDPVYAAVATRADTPTHGPRCRSCRRS